jgi:hypothetical protein
MFSYTWQFSWSSFGKSSSGLLPSDRPNTFKGYLYYDIPWLHKMTTDLGIFQVMYQGTPQASFEDVGASSVFYALAGGGYSVNVVGRGNWCAARPGRVDNCQLLGVNFRASTSGRLPGDLRATSGLRPTESYASLL